MSKPVVDGHSLQIPSNHRSSDTQISTVYMEFYAKLVYNSIRGNKLFDILYRHWPFIESNHLPQTSLSQRGLEGKKNCVLIYLVVC